ncbi:hypothetical protein [Massilia sp. TWP1-3-3]|uniref:hypothetical protein n=1 Tax=Massilia sp. TWP1-3-3 TaxID=2804573 RepID=UPI003CF02365
MQIDKLQIELRPRSHAQALDLGFALLRSHAGAAYKSFLVLWLPLAALCAALTLYLPDLGWLWAVLAWWVRPMLERAPLYVLSRQVFGTAVTWQEAVRAWPGQLGGGAWQLLTWGRIFAAGRGLMQPVWQLEMARDDVAAVRRRVLRANGTGQAAFWFGIVCVVLELVLEFGLIYFLAMFAGDGDGASPFRLLFGEQADVVGNRLGELMWLGAYTVAGGIMAPIYTACGFTLYLNRRASLEAWDLELQLRQIRRPVLAKPHTPGAPALSLLLATLAAACALGAAPDADARAAAPATPAALSATCDGPKLDLPARGKSANAHQAQVRQQVDQVYQHKDLRGFECVENWQPKPAKIKAKKKEKKRDASGFPNLPNLGFLASIFKIVFIALGIGVVAYLLYRYRDHFPAFSRGVKLARATEVGGLDIRAESLPPDVTAQVRALWASGERRAALALLYRATLSRLVSDDGLALRQGDTEGDCLRAATHANGAQRLGHGRLEVARAATTLWLNGAYGDRWPDDGTVHARCAEWDQQFGAAREKRA